MVKGRTVLAPTRRTIRVIVLFSMLSVRLRSIPASFLPGTTLGLLAIRTTFSLVSSCCSVVLHLPFLPLLARCTAFVTALPHLFA
jgi:hypothetical protein